MDLNIAPTYKSQIPNADYFEEEKGWNPIGYQDNEDFDFNLSELLNEGFINIPNILDQFPISERIQLDCSILFFIS